MTFDRKSLVPAKRKVEEPPEAAQGWKAADLDDDELVDDDAIVADPDNDLDERPVVSD